jgi:DNA-binding transcriptional ArsR family regulator
MDTLAHTLRISRALGDHARISILVHLRHGARCVGALAARLDVTPSAVSQHLRVLRDAGLVAADRRGRFTHYHLVEAAIAKHTDALRRILLDANAPCGKGTGCTVHAHRDKASKKDGLPRLPIIPKRKMHPSALPLPALPLDRRGGK